MTAAPITTYPGTAATPAQLARLADEYRQAAVLVRTMGRRGKPLSYAPFRLTAIQAIELYLNAFLLMQGHPPKRLRGFQHDLGALAELAVAGGLTLRGRTAAHLAELAAAREYLVTRYAPEVTLPASNVTRLDATLAEVATKVATKLRMGRSAEPSAGSADLLNA